MLTRAAAEHNTNTLFHILDNRQKEILDSEGMSCNQYQCQLSIRHRAMKDLSQDRFAQRGQDKLAGKLHGNIRMIKNRIDLNYLDRTHSAVGSDHF